MSTNFYEITYVISPVLEEDQFKETVSQVTSLIESNGGKIDEMDEWGVQKLAYEMDGKNNGYYVNGYFHAPSEAIKQIERQLRINDNILRYLTLKFDSRMHKHYELKKKGEMPTLFEETEEEKED